MTSWVETASDRSYTRQEMDPLGAETGRYDPYQITNNPVYDDVHGNEPLYREGGDPFDLSSGCGQGGMPVPCSFSTWSAGRANADGYGLGDSGFELRPDFLTRFAFHHLEGDKVAVRLGLPPHYGFNRSQHEQLELFLPISVAMRRHFALAATHQEGFLMQDAPKLDIEKSTVFMFETVDSKGIYQ